MKRVQWPTEINPARFDISNGSVYSKDFEDVYFSADGGWAEKRYVFVEGNGLPRRFEDTKKFTIVELGFGLGINFLATLEAFLSTARSGMLDYVAFELHPFRAVDLAACLKRICPRSDLVDLLIDQLPPLLSGFHRLCLAPNVTLTLIYGDAAHYIKELDARVDAFFLDGFAPHKNQDLWSPKLVASFRRLAARDATFSTYSSAGNIRRMMTYAGFDVQKRKGFGRKREMLVGRFSEKGRTPHSVVNRVSIVGGGIAGVTLAIRLLASGTAVTIFETQNRLLSNTSSNPIPVIRPNLSLDFGPRGQLAWLAYFFAARCYERIHRVDPIGFNPRGVIQLPRAKEEWEKIKQAASILDLDEDHVRLLPPESLGSITALAMETGGVLFPRAGVLDSPQSGLIDAFHRLGGESRSCPLDLDDKNSSLEEGLFNESDNPIVIANSHDAHRFLPKIELRLTPIRGQSSAIRRSDRASDVVVCKEGYVASSADLTWISGTHDVNVSDATSNTDDDQENLKRLSDIFRVTNSSQLVIEKQWSGVRYATYDRLPLVGRVSNSLYAILGLGSRGFTWSPLMSEVIYSELLGLSSPLERSLTKRLLPTRFGDIG